MLSLLALTATACSGEASRLGLPEPITEQGKRILTLWQGSWIAAFATGAVVWGLIIWAVLFHRKRSDDLPPQVRYNLPIEMLYTAVPFIMIAVLFYFTARDENYIEKTSKSPDVLVNVIGFQWSWEFDYPQYQRSDGSPVGVVGTPSAPDANPGTKPVLVIPVGKKIRFNLHTNDVIHSFWVPAFLYKKDVMPGPKDNQFEITPTRTGTYEGRCAELCGVDHSRMLFQVKVVTPAEFQTFIDQHKAVGGAQ
ncbi:MAG: cytochrome c oxidase subunit [Streptosporangiaceae bacterium]|jgi:cytochrome c oxidase subunit 2|nr:cytochrome c oxidase, subunit [Streptosporangiaceae bacterium]MDX6427651.1 cytochrome c oxidase subunit [Streptosporangiaceae bacterium]